MSSDERASELVGKGQHRTAGGLRPQWSPDTGTYTECENCETPMTSDLARVYGDNQNRLWHCLSCPHITITDMRNGAGADPEYDAEEREYPQ